MTDKQLEIARNCIYACETGGQIYGKARYDCYVGSYTNSGKETACTIGAGGNHAGTAKKLMQMILEKYPTIFRKNDTAGIEADLKKSWDSYDPGVGSKKAKCIQRIISTPEGIKCQDELLNRQILARAEKVNKLGVTSIDAQIFAAEIIHLGGNSAFERVLKKTDKPYTLNNLYKALKTDQNDTSNDNQVGDKKYWSRHEKIYGWLKDKISNNGGEIQMGSINGLISRAKSELGYIEKASNSNLDSKTGNKGTANYTKYARDIANLGLSGCQGQPWCITFQFWLEVQEFGLEKALEHWHMTKKTYVGYNCFSTYNAFPANKRSKTPKLGDVVIFTQSHAGRVVGINGNTFVTIEGNTSPKPYDRNGGMVAQKTYNISDPKIKGFLHIDYNISTSSPTTSINLKKGSAGKDVKTLQEQLLLTGFCGCDYYATNNFVDGDFGANTEKYVKLMQKSAGIEVDGIYGINSKDALSKYVDAAKSSSINFTANIFLANALKVAKANKIAKFSYGNATCLPSVNADDKLTSCDRFVGQVLWTSGLKDVGNRAVNQLATYLSSKGAIKIIDISKIKAGDIIFFNAHTFILGKKIKEGIWERYDSGSKDRIQLTGTYASYSSQPFHEGLEGFLYAYRLPFKTSTTTNTSTSASPENNVSKGQKWLNTNYSSIIKSATGKLLDVDGSYGAHSRWATLAVWKDVVNRKYGYKLTPSNKNFGTSCKTAASKATIKNGSNGTFVYIVQFILAAKGYYKGKMDADFGGGTKAAVIAYQKSKKLSQDGICGANTWYSLFN